MAASPPLFQHIAVKRRTGLDNPGTARNCFLNSALQSLFNIELARFFFLDPPAEYRAVDVVDKIGVLFANMHHSDEASVTPLGVRQALSERFKTDEMSDAAEAFEAILLAVHGTELDKPCVLDHCLSHEVFAFEAIESVRCLSPHGCRRTDASPSAKEFIFRVSAFELAELATKFPDEDLCSLLGRQGKLLECKHCGYRALRERTLVTPAKVFVLQMVLTSAVQSRPEDRARILKLLARTTQSFHTVFRTNENLPTLTYALSGFITYYGSHYIYFGLDAQRGTWIMYDDSVVTPLGAWSKVEQTCLKGSWQPVLCLYAETDFNE